jgi:hypothetical protein
MRRRSLRHDPAWRAMFARLDAKIEAERIALCQERWTFKEIAAVVRRWRRLTRPGATDRLIARIQADTEAGA